MRAVAGIVVGLIVSLLAAVIVGIIAVGMTFSLPPGTNAADTGQVVAVFESMPQATQLALAAAWLLSAFAGAFVARRISDRVWVAWVVSLLAIIYFALNAIILAQPSWVEALWVIAPFLGGLLGATLAKGRAPEAVLVEAGDDPAEA